MGMIDLTVYQKVLDSNIKYCREKGITLPTFEMMKNPELVPEKIKARLKNVGLWDLNHDNLYRITWKNEPKKVADYMEKLTISFFHRSLQVVRQILLFFPENTFLQDHIK